MNLYAIDFTPPMSGFKGKFNTFRIGRVWSKRLKVGDEVLLLDKKQCLIFGRAVVTGLKTGALAELAEQCAYLNHNQKGQARDGAPERLMESLRKRYGPHIIHEGKLTTVIDLRML
jgi:hypothetical protein